MSGNRMFTFPPVAPMPALVVTPMMKSIMQTTWSVTAGGGLCVWTGPSRMGKTTTARFMEREVNGAYCEEDPSAFRVSRFQVSGDGYGRKTGRLLKRGIRVLYEGVTGTQMDSLVYRDRLAEEVASKGV